jgi:hypothetical protein
MTAWVRGDYQKVSLVCLLLAFWPQAVLKAGADAEAGNAQAKVTTAGG